jgi:hypothetical protein
MKGNKIQIRCAKMLFNQIISTMNEKLSMKLFMTIPIAFILSGLVFVGTGQAATYYVCQTATGNGSGDSYDNCKSVSSHNSGSFSADDIIYLCDNITSQVTPPSSGSSDSHRITYRGDYSGHAGTIGPVTGKGIYLASKNWITIQNLAVTQATGTGIELNGSSGITISNCNVTYCDGGIWTYNGASNWIIENSTISYSNVSGFLASDNSGSGIIRRNTIDSSGQSTDASKCTPGNTGASWYHAVYIDYTTSGETQIYENKLINTRCGHGLKLKASVNAHHNWIEGNSCWNVYLVEKGGVTSTQKIHNNIIIQPASGWKVGIKFWQESSATATLYIYNNTIYQSTGAEGIGFGSPSESPGPANAYIKNNIIYDTSYAISAGSGCTPRGTTQIDGNLIYTSAPTEFYWNGAARNFSYWQNTLGFDTHGKNDQDPKFQNTGNHQFWLQSSSPAIDAGLNLGSDYDDALTSVSSWPSSVVTANQNSYGNGWEIGAYVYAPAPSTPAPPKGLRVIP